MRKPRKPTILDWRGPAEKIRSPDCITSALAINFRDNMCRVNGPLASDDRWPGDLAAWAAEKLKAADQADMAPAGAEAKRQRKAAHRRVSSCPL